MNIEFSESATQMKRAKVTLKENTDDPQNRENHLGIFS